MFVWRIETEQGKGYYTADYNGSSPIHGKYGASMPCPHRDGGELGEWFKDQMNKHRLNNYSLRNVFPWVCGFDGFIQLFNWFDTVSCTRNRCAHFRLALYQVNREHVKIGEHQVMFHRDHAVLIHRFDFGPTLFEDITQIPMAQAA